MPLILCRSSPHSKAALVPFARLKLLRYATIAPALLIPRAGNLTRLSTGAIFGFIRFSNSSACRLKADLSVGQFDTKPQQKLTAAKALMTNAND